MAKTASSEAAALAALAGALTDPTPKVLFGSKSVPGFFTGSAQPVKAAAKYCEDQHWLEATGESVGKGAKAKKKYRLTSQGVQAVLERAESLPLLRSLDKSVQGQLDLIRNVQEKVGAIVGQFQPLREAIASLEKRLQPPDVEQILRTLSATREPTRAPDNSWLNAVVALAAQQRQRDRLQPVSLPAIYTAVRRTQPNLTLGQFHDGLRALCDEKRIRLLPFTRALATIEDARNALFLDGEVMYYVDLP